MRTRILVPIFGVAFLLTGSGHAQQQQNAIRGAAIQAKQTCDSAYSDPAITPILDKIAINVKDITLPMRANTQHVIASEKPAIEAWMRARKACSQAWDALRRSNMQPAIYAVQRGVEDRTDSFIVELYSGKLTYGEFNNKRIENVTEGGREIATIKQNMAAQEQQRQDNLKAEQQQRQDNLRVEQQQRRDYQKATNCAAARAQVAQEEANGPAPGLAALFQGMDEQLTINRACN